MKSPRPVEWPCLHCLVGKRGSKSTKAKLRCMDRQSLGQLNTPPAWTVARSRSAQSRGPAQLERELAEVARWVWLNWLCSRFGRLSAKIQSNFGKIDAQEIANLHLQRPHRPRLHICRQSSPSTEFEGTLSQARIRDGLAVNWGSQPTDSHPCHRFQARWNSISKEWQLSQIHCHDQTGLPNHPPQTLPLLRHLFPRCSPTLSSLRDADLTRTVECQYQTVRTTCDPISLQFCEILWD